MFDGVTIKDSAAIIWVKRWMKFMIIALLVIGAVSAHRAYFQVRSLDLKAPQVLEDRAVIEVEAVGSGRGPIDVVATLTQGDQSETIFTFRVPGNELGFFDPRPQRVFYSMKLNDEVAVRFKPGAVRLRVVATGRPAWGRLPPPTVREADVTIPSR